MCYSRQKDRKTEKTGLIWPALLYTLEYRCKFNSSKDREREISQITENTFMWRPKKVDKNSVVYRIYAGRLHCPMLIILKEKQDEQQQKRKVLFGYFVDLLTRPIAACCCWPSLWDYTSIICVLLYLHNNN